MVWKFFLSTLGAISLFMGVLGVFVPLLPTTPFLILSTWCFMKSSPKMHDWIFSHKILGPPLKDWEEKGVISFKSKIITITFLVSSILAVGMKVEIIWLKLLLVNLLIIVSVFIVSRPSK